jgi:hypothetical protein
MFFVVINETVDTHNLFRISSLCLQLQCLKSISQNIPLKYFVQSCWRTEDRCCPAADKMGATLGLLTSRKEGIRLRPTSYGVSVCNIDRGSTIYYH